MNTSTQARAVLLGLLVACSGSFAQAQQAGFEAARAYLQAHHKALDLTPADVDALVVNAQHLSAPTGITHLYLQQQIDGVPVYNAIVNVAIAQDGRVVHVGNSAVSGLETVFRSEAQGLSAEGAVEAAARELGLEVTEPLRAVPTRQLRQGPFETVRLTGGGIASEDIRAQLVYVPTEHSGLRLAWLLELYTRDGNELWHLGVDAATGEILVKESLVDEDHWAVDDFFPEGWPMPAPSDHAANAAPVSLAPLAAGTSSLLSAIGSYRVYAWPYESPAHAGDPFTDLRTLQANPADVTASQLGWHDTGVTQYTVTRGNNVHAYTDVDANGIPDPGSDPDGGAGLVFDFGFDPSTQQPAAYRDAAVTNLFYWNNLIHDITYRYGFDEASGNFQVNNFGNGGLGNDDVRAEAQDGSGTNNANFLTPTDGSRPRMQMFVWNSPFQNELVVGAPVNQSFIMSSAAFGPPFTVAGVTGPLALVDDGTALPNEGCSPLVGFPAGSIAVAYRGSCSFVIKTRNAQNAGALAIVIINNAPGNPITLGDDGTGGDIIISAGMISQDNGAVVVANLPVSATARNLGAAALDRDSDFDNGVIVHEYAHGISNRLTGGPNINCLSGQEQMGEGWSDYYALLLTDDNTENRGIGTYVVFEPPTGRGIRAFPYSRDFAVNPSTYDLIKTAAVPHGVGSVWATMLWDMTRDLVDRHGFNPDIYQGWSTGGNNLALQLVTEGLKIQGCGPGFVTGRNAIMAADAAMTGSANQCLIWDAFARRGLGFSADQGSNASRLDGTEAFDLPVYCSTFAMVAEQVQALVDDGTLNNGQANSLLTKLRNAEKKIGQGQPSAALSMINTFLNEVAALVRSQRLTQAQADVLVEYANGLIARIHEFYPDAARGGEVAGLGEADKSSAAVPEVFALDQNYPNPFNARTEIRFALPEAVHVKLVVYDVIGREVARLVDADLEAGFHQAALDASQLASGVYLYRMEAGTFVSTQRMVLVK